MPPIRGYQPSFTAGELSPALWARVDLAKYATGLKTAVNMFIHAHGGASNRPGLEFICEVKDSTKLARLVPFQFNTQQSYMLVYGDENARVIRDGGVVVEGATISAVTQASPGVVTATAHPFDNGDEVTISGVVGMTELNGNTYTVANKTTDTFELSATNTTGFTAYVSGGAAFGENPFEFTTPYSDTDAQELAYIQEADVMYQTMVEHPVQKLSRLADYDWSLTAPTFAPLIAAPGGVGAARVTGTGATTYKYKVAAVAESGEESLPSAEASVTNDLSIATYKNRVTWSAVTDAVRYIVYKDDNGVFGYIGGTEGLQFDDENIVADLADVPQKGLNPFDAAGKYPRVATFVDQRLVLASTKDEPQAVWASQSANYENFGRASPAKESDAITFRIRAKQVNEVRGLLPFRGLMILTSGGEFIATGSEGEYLNQTPRVVPQGYRGSSRTQAIVVGNTVLFAQDRGGVVRDFSYEFAEDSFTGKDLTILARHLFEDREIKAWAYAQAPYSIVWVVLDDGSLVSMTYMKEHDVWGWTRHQTDGVFEDVAVIAEGKEDVPYFIVRREVGGVDKRYVERLHTRMFDTIEEAFFVDSGLSYSGTPISVITLEHLKGKEIVALVDGNVVTGLTADASTGQVTLPNAGAVIHAGLGYTSKMQTLDLDMGSVPGMGSVQARWKTVTEATMRVEKTRGIWTGPTEDNLVEYKQRAGEAWNEAIGAFTGDISITPNWDWTKGGTTWVVQFDPLPMTVLSIMPDVVVGR